MLKRAVAWIAVGMLLFASAPVWAGGGQLTLNPNPVRQKTNLTITATDCVSGETWSAIVVVEIHRTNADGPEVYRAEVPADDSGTTVIKVRINKANFKRGTHVAFVDCIHEFDDGGTGTWYETDTEFRVKRPRAS